MYSSGILIGSPGTPNLGQPVRPPGFAVRDTRFATSPAKLTTPMAKQKREPLDPATKKKRLRRRLIVYSALVLAFVGAYKFQPIEFDFFPRHLPPKTKVDPDTKKL